jgi:hypothetical protein
MKKLFQAAAICVALFCYSGASFSAGYATGNLWDYGYYREGAIRLIYITMDQINNYSTPILGVNSNPPDIQLGNECIENSYVMIDLADPTVDKDEILMFLSLAKALKKPVQIQVEGCVSVDAWGLSYPRLVAVEVL